MLDFLPLDKNVNVIKDYLPLYGGVFCDFSLGVKYMWRNNFVIEYAFFDDTLILKESCKDYENAFYYPVGKNPSGALEEIEKYCQATNKKLMFCCVDNLTASALSRRYSVVKVANDRDWSDYIYDANSFKAFSGRKYSGQRNHINKFKKLYPDSEFVVATKKDIPELCKFVSDTLLRLEFSVWSEKAEADNLLDYVSNMFNLNQLCGFVRVNGKIIAVSVGEIIGDSLIVHVEKADKSYEGVYPFLANSFAKTFANGVNFINREEDCGDMGLRISKLQYQPVEVREKNTVTVKTCISLINEKVELLTERVKISAIKEEDKLDYYNLYTNDSLNKYWGYDYKEDLKNELPTPEYFYAFQQKLKESGEEFDFAVRLNEKMIGEIALYGFDYFGGAEIGFRLTQQYQNNGYATESVKAVINYFFTELKGKLIKSRCYKQNDASKKLIERLGFVYKNQSSTHYFFELKKQ